MPASRSELSWSGPVLTFDGARILVAVFRSDRSTDEQLVMWKTRPLLEATLDLVDELAPRRIVELGIAEGGSTALLALYARPELLVAVDLNPEPHAVLEAFLESRGLHQVETRYGFDQADPAALDELRQRLGPEPIDLVIDDASHRLDPTRASFNALFPLLRPGGVYAIEDWDWGHRGDVLEVDPDVGHAGWWPGGDPLSILAFEATVATADPGIVRSVTADTHYLRITRGDAVIDPEGFDLRRALPGRGRRLLAAVGDGTAPT